MFQIKRSSKHVACILFYCIELPSFILSCSLLSLVQIFINILTEYNDGFRCEVSYMYMICPKDKYYSTTPSSLPSQKVT